MWPLSRRERPKQFLSLVSQRSLLEDTIVRLTPVVPAERIFVIAEEEILLAARPLCPELPVANLIAEPAARNTWPCCLWGTAAIAARLGEDVVVWVIPADQTVRDESSFRRSLVTGAARAATGAVVAFGITPSRPETGYGYIRLGKILDAGPPRVYEGLSFTEKPDAATAARYVAAGEYVWNSGMFVWRADAFDNACAHCREEDLSAARAIREDLVAGKLGAAAARYVELEATSVDYAIMERLPSFEVVEMACGWDDIGSFEALERVLPRDDAGNVTRGESFLVDARGNVVVSRGRPIFLLGAEDMVVVDAGDAVLIYPKGRGQDVRRVVEVAREKRPDLL